MKEFDHSALPEETKALVLLAFRNGPIEAVHQGKICPTCGSAPGYSRITNAEMKVIMKAAVDKLYTLLRVKAEDPARYLRQIEYSREYTTRWDQPTYVPQLLNP